MRFMHSTKYAGVALLITFAVVGCIVSGCTGQQARVSGAQPVKQQAVAAEDQQTALIHQGKLIFDETPKYAKDYVGAKVACGDCHIQSGTAAYAAPMINLAGLFPMYNKRAGRVISLQNRIQECFARSENGRPLPVDSHEMQALVAYINWLSRDGEKGKPYAGRGFVKMPALTGDPVRGKAVYASQCAICHGTDGAGVSPILPPVWGPDSYNDGAGMNNPDKMAAFVMHNMPQNNPGTLTSQEAYDVSAFIHTMPRPKFNEAYKSY